MKETYRESLASHSGHEPYAGSSNVSGVAWVSGDAGQPLSSEIEVPVYRPYTDKGKTTSLSLPRQDDDENGGVIDPEPVSKSSFKATLLGRVALSINELAKPTSPAHIILRARKRKPDPA